MQMEKENSRWSKTAIAGFILSIIGLLMGLGLSSFGILPASSLILGILSIRKIKRSENKIRGKGLAIVAIILGSIGLIIPLWILISVIRTSIARL